MIKYFHSRHEGVFDCRYDFDRSGETIPMHSHLPPMYHSVKVLRGSVRVNNRIVLCGEAFIPENDQPHEIVALEPRTAILNTYLNGEPEEYKTLTLQQLEGVISCPIRSPLMSTAPLPSP
jgi:hypothetical protein